jgi:hypothetical protein
LGVRLGLQRREVADRLRVGEWPLDGQRRRVNVSTSPERVIALLDSLLELVAHRLSLVSLKPELVSACSSRRIWAEKFSKLVLWPE